MTSRTMAAIALLVPLAACGCSCGARERDEAMRASTERWVLIGHYVNPRESGPPTEDWVATLQAPQGTMRQLLPVPLKTPSGKTVLFPRVAYSDPRKLLICMTQEMPGKLTHDDVWRHDLVTGQAHWIGQGRWDNTMGFAWSPDGSKLAFVASAPGSDAVVMQYDVDTDELEEVAGNVCPLGDGVVRIRRPVYSEDGTWLYYVSADGHVTRVSLATSLANNCLLVMLLW